MENTSAIMSARQAAELDFAFDRNGWNAEEVKKLSTGNILSSVREVILGRSEIRPKEHAWTEENGIIRFSVTSDGTTGPAWIKRLEKKGFRIGDYAKSILKSKDFKPTSGIPTEVVVLKGMLFSDENRVTKKIWAYAETLSFNSQKPEKPNPEIACLIREKFSDEDLKAMGLVWIVAMHEPINDSDGDPNLLNADRIDDGHWLNANWDNPDSRW